MAQKTNESTTSELRYRRLFESAQDGILILDFSTGVIHDANPFISDLLGYSKDELVGKELWEIGPMIDKAAALSAFKELKVKGYIRYEDLPLRSKSGQIRNVEFVSNAYEVAGERVIQCNIRDISDRLIVEKELLKYQRSQAISMREMIATLGSVIVARDPYTALHQKRVASLSVAIADEMGLPAHNIEGIEIAGLLHDIGKISIPAEVLTKSGQLSFFEMAMLKNHVQAGYDMLKHLHLSWPIALVILQHHERIDGSGYPNGIKLDSILEEARIIAVADAVEAMSSDRPYRKGKGLTLALSEIENAAGKLFDPVVVAACLKVFRQDGYAFSEFT